MAWSASTSSSICWQNTSAITDSADGVDFMVLRVDNQFPWAVNDTRPCYIVDASDKEL